MEKILNELIDGYKEDMVRALSDFVKIDSTNGAPEEGAPFGRGCRQALDHAMELAESAGFEQIENTDDKVCVIDYGTGSKVVGVFAHLDIVAAGDGWTVPPFGGVIKDNRIYGRGTVDNKGPFVASLFALKAIKESGLPLGDDYRIRLVGGTNEEVGMDDMRAYLAHYGAPDAGFTPDGMFPMSFTERVINYYYLRTPFQKTAEDPFLVVKLTGGKTLNMVPDTASAILRAASPEYADSAEAALKDFCRKTDSDIRCERQGNDLLLSAAGLTAHSNTPMNGKNAVVALIMFFACLPIGGSQGEFFRMFAEKIGFTTDGSKMGMKRKDECGELTYSVSRMELDGEQAEWVVNIRLPFTYNDGVTPDYTEQMRQMNTTVDKVDSHPGYRYPADHPLLLTLRSVYEEMTGKDSTPGHEGGTYAKQIPNIVPFGSIFPENPDLCHRPDEYVDIDELVLDAKIYANAMYELTKHSYPKIER